jgi:hypothetical protein
MIHMFVRYLLVPLKKYATCTGAIPPEWLLGTFIVDCVNSPWTGLGINCLRTICCSFCHDQASFSLLALITPQRACACSFCRHYSYATGSRLRAQALPARYGRRSLDHIPSTPSYLIINPLVTGYAINLHV